jgi:hypothetical protein
MKPKVLVFVLYGHEAEEGLVVENGCLEITQGKTSEY